MKKLKTAAAITSIIAIVAVVAALASINPRDSAQAQADSGICGRDAAVQTVIIASIADVSLCADVTDAHLTAINGTLDLSGGTLTTLATSDLQGLSGVTDLDLSNNDIDDLPSNIFDALTALQEIDLSGNGMSMLPPYPFHHNLNLQVIDASDNDIPLLHEGIFSNNRALREVDFSDNEITYLSGTEFKSSPLLTKIDLANNSLPGLAVGMFDGLENLAELYLAGNTGAPFTVDMQPLGLGANAFTVATGGGAPPFNATATVTATGGTLSHSTVSFLAGRDLTEVITVTHLGAEPATITVSGAAFTAGTYTGITASNGTTLSIPQNGATTGICSRTREIQNAIITLLGSASCATVTNTQLASITKPLAVAGTSMSTLREGDLDGLTGVRDLYLYGNEITELPDELFKDAGSFDRVLIQDNPGGPFKLEVTLTEKKSGHIRRPDTRGQSFPRRGDAEGNGSNPLSTGDGHLRRRHREQRDHGNSRQQRRRHAGRDRPSEVQGLGNHELLVLRRVRTHDRHQRGCNDDHRNRNLRTGRHTGTDHRAARPDAADRQQ